MVLIRNVILVCAAIAAVALGVYFLGGGGSDEEAGNGGRGREVFARVVAIETQPEIVRLEAVGTARALRSVMLYPDDDGEVVDVAFAAGQEVAEGAILLKLDHEDEALAVEIARVKAADAERLLDRYTRAKTGAVSETQIDTARTTLAESRLALKQAEVALEDRYVRAPFDGTVGLTDIDVGDRVDTDTEIAAFDDLSALLVDFVVPEQFLGRIKDGGTVGLKPWTADTDAVEARIAGIDSRVDVRTRAFRARARIDNPAPALRPGMSFRVSAGLVGAAYPVVPEAAIVWGANGSFVWEIRDGTAYAVPVIIVQRNPGVALVEADLQAGDLVVYEGVQTMREGISVGFEVVAPARRPERADPALRMTDEGERAER